MPGRPYRLVVLGTSRVGKTALIEHMIFGNHVIGLVSCYSVLKNIILVTLEIFIIFLLPSGWDEDLRRYV